MKLQVFDPPMCCSTGICGTKVDKVLTRFAADLVWLKNQGVTVSRYNLAQQPLVFAENESVRAAMSEDEACLPLILVDGKIVSRGRYPERQELSVFAGVKEGDTGDAAASDEDWCDAVTSWHKKSTN